jgi:transketolase
MGTGSLGHGAGLGLGAALGKKGKKSGRVFVVISDGELQEGSTWETFINAPALGATNLTVVVDSNDFQSLGRTSETHPNMYPIEDKLTAFGWNVKSVDGHDSDALVAALRDSDHLRPTFVVAKTIKGKGVSFMENVPMWHYRSPNPEEYIVAVKEIRGY